MYGKVMIRRKSKTTQISVLTTQTTLAEATSEVFHRSDLRDLPEQLRRELQVPETEPYTVVQVEGNNSIVCGICNRQFGTLKGWRIHASMTHKQDGFSARCSHYFLLPPEYTAAQQIAAVGLHALDCCPAVIKRKARKAPAIMLFRPSHAADLSLPVPSPSLFNDARPSG
uniref:C2H2-type domain-containing protein n=1 Tax=Loa loa TaxID=7209 RepID=A0A1I7W2E2_LOALO